jgi:hypothetical protein
MVGRALHVLGRRGHNELRVAIRTPQRTGRILSKHQTRTAALDNWRLDHVGERVWIWRTYSDGDDYLVVEGTWHRPIEPV